MDPQEPARTPDSPSGGVPVDEGVTSSRPLVPGKPLTLAVPPNLPGQWVRCSSDAVLEVGDQYFDVPRVGRAKLTLSAHGEVSDMRVQVEDPSGELRCNSDWTNTSDGITLSWTGLVGPGRHRVWVATTAREGDEAAPPADSQVEVTLELRPPPRQDYETPLGTDEIRPARDASGQMRVGDTSKADARVRLSCTDEGAPTEAFALTVDERSTFRLWIPPEIDSGANVFAVLRPKGEGYEELDCGHMLSATLARGRYLLVVAGAPGGRFGEFFLPVELHSLEAEHRAARAARRLPLGRTVKGSTSGRSDVFNHCDIRRVGHNAPDRAYKVSVPRAGRLTVEVEPAGDYSGWVSIRSSTLEPINDDGDDCAPFPYSALSVPVSPGEYVIVVDGIGLSLEEAGPSFEGSFSIRARLDASGLQHTNR